MNDIKRNEKNEILIVDLNDLIFEEKNKKNIDSDYLWVKTIIGINKKYTNGYSLIGDFLKSPLWVKPGSILLYCFDYSSKRFKKCEYFLIKLYNDLSIKLLYNNKYSNKWAIELWSIVEKELNNKNTINLLSDFGDIYLINELINRGYNITKRNDTKNIVNSNRFNVIEMDNN